MAEAQSVYGPEDRSTGLSGEAAFGRCLRRILPEDAFDFQPLLSAGEARLFVADVRIDNRDAVADALGLPKPAAGSLSDSALLMRAWDKWRDAALEKVVGDFAFAAWDGPRRELVIARDALGQRPLHFWMFSGGFAFASMPSGLHALGVERAPDVHRLAEFLADLAPVNGRVGFRYIEALPAGHLLRWSPEGVRRRRYWDPSPRELRMANSDEYVEAYREQLDRAVRSRLRGCGESVATQLSSGYDSGAVTATAARLLRHDGGKVTAFTAAPRRGFSGAVPRGRIADESGVAALVADLHPNVEHVILRPDGTSPFDLLGSLHRYSQYPGGHICNHVWWSAILRGASERGLRVLLTGEQGNLTISAGGLPQLADLVRKGRMLRWVREARAVRPGMGVTWKGVLAASFGPWMPKLLWRQIVARFQGFSARHNAPFLLAEPLRSEMMVRNAAEARDPRPPGNSIEQRLDFLKRADQGSYRKASLAVWGVDERDPTADTRLIDFCLSLPADQLLRDGVRRPLARRALADRLPEEVLSPHARGYQMADWYEQIKAGDARRLATHLASSAAATFLVDFGQVMRMIDGWPGEDLNRLQTIGEYRMGLLRALDAAAFAAWAEDGMP